MSLYPKFETHFIGPCPHGRDPYERCDEEDDPEGGGCGRLEPAQAECVALRAECERLKAAYKLADNDIVRIARERDEARATLAEREAQIMDLRNKELERLRTMEKLVETLREREAEIERLKAEEDSDTKTWHRLLEGVRAERDEARAEIERLKAWVDNFEKETRALPIQHEDESKGQSSFNWRMWFVREIRRALASDTKGDGT